MHQKKDDDRAQENTKEHNTCAHSQGQAHVTKKVKHTREYPHIHGERHVTTHTCSNREAETTTTTTTTTTTRIDEHVSHKVGKERACIPQADTPNNTRSSLWQQALKRARLQALLHPCILASHILMYTENHIYILTYVCACRYTMHMEKL